jgi:multidrug resistance efflux pump
MRFQQKGYRPYDPEGVLLPPVKTRIPSRRLWLVRPRNVLFALGALLVVWLVADRLWVRGNGIVAGELTAVSPIVQARLQQLLVKCLDHVTQGQRLAEFVNEATQQSSAQQLLQLQLQLTQARAQIDISDREAQVAQKLTDAQLVLLKQQREVLKAQEELLKGHFVATLVWQQAKAAVDRAEAEAAAAQFVYESKLADKKRAELDADVLQKRIDSFIDSPELNGHFYLTAPKDGIVTQCTARPGEVIAARTSILQIFNPAESYAVVFFSPGDIPNISRGQVFDINVEGSAKTITGTVKDFYPELSALPASLTRYFWQQEKWSQYVPVRIEFDALSPSDRASVFAWSQLTASRRAFGESLDFKLSSWLPWQKAKQGLEGSKQDLAESSGQQPKDRR